MRITGGNFRGRILHPPANLPVRPTTDFSKTALFNILANHFDFEELHVLDLFAGAGSITFEFASRNSKQITSVDENQNCIRFIKKAASELGVNTINAIRSDAFRFLNAQHEKWDIIFADPPFILEETDRLPGIVFEKNLLKKSGWLIVEHQAKRALKGPYIADSVRKYGNCAFSIFRNDHDGGNANMLSNNIN